MPPIAGKVAAIVGPRGVIINRGSKDGVEKGMMFKVMLILPDIVDPDDPSNRLAGVGFEKGRIEVNSAFVTMSYAVLLELPNGAAGAGFGDEPGEYPKLERAFLIAASDWTIRAGDRVVQIELPPS